MSDPFQKLMKKLEANGVDCMEKQPKPAAERVHELKAAIIKQEKWEKENPILAGLYDVFGDSARDMKFQLDDALIDRRAETVENTARCTSAFLGMEKKSAPQR